MAKRKQHPEEELPFVALMDTMTNVVGVLIIVLVMMAISLANAVRKVISDLAPATQAQVQAASREAETLRGKLKQIPSRKDDPVSLKARIASLEQELPKLRKEYESKAGTSADPSLQNREISRLESELNAVKTKAASDARVLAELKASIAAVPEAKPAPAKIVRLPDAKPVPKDAKIHYVIVTGAGVRTILDHEAKQLFLTEMQSPAARQMSRMIKQGKSTSQVYDHKKMNAYFASRTVENPTYKLKVLLEDWRRSAAVTPVVKPSALEPLPQALMLNSNFVRDVRTIRNNTPGSVLIFKVDPDGFENYLALREIVNSMGMPAGWKIDSSMEGAGFGISEIPMDQLAPLKPSAPSKPQRPNAPSLKLD